MDRRRSILNISAAVISRVILLTAALVVRRLLIKYIGNDANGLESLFASIIGALSVAELGVGSAIVFSMYSPIVNNDTGEVVALYQLYRKAYLYIGMVIMIAGLIVMPMLPHLINDYQLLNINVYVPYLLTLTAVVLSYLYSAKTSLIEAYKDNYITTGILTVSRLICYGTQIIVILIWQSYTLFVVCRIIETIIIWLLTTIAVRNLHGDILGRRDLLGDDKKTEVTRNVKAMFMHKIGAILCGAIDNIIISAFIGVIILGKYSNYVFIAGVLSGTLGLFFSPLTSIIGHLCAKNDPIKARVIFSQFYSVNFVLGLVFFLGYYAVIDNVVSLCFGGDLKLSRALVFIITLKYFTQFMRKSQLLFRNASGTFYNDRWKPVIEGIANLFLSLLFVNIFPDEYRVAGVIVATIITALFICHTVEPYVVFHNVFGLSPKMFYVRNYSYTALFVICVIIMDLIKKSYDSDIISLLINGSLSLPVSLGALMLIAAADKTFRRQLTGLLIKIKPPQQRA